MRENLAVRAFVRVAAFIMTTLLVSAAAVSQSATSPAAEPVQTEQASQATSSTPEAVPAALLDALRKEQVAFVLHENPRLDPESRAALMRSLRQYFPAGRVVRGKESAELVMAIGVFDEKNLASEAGDVTPLAANADEQKAAARKPFRVLLFRPAEPSQTIVLYESASVGRGGVSQRRGADKRRAALDLAMKNLALVASTGKR